MTSTTTSTRTTHAPDVSDLARAIERTDVDGVVAWYAHEATITIVDRDHPPSTPLILRGKGEISSYYQDVCGRDVKHEVRDLVSSETQLAFAEHCRYPDGLRVLCITTATRTDGRIADQTVVQVWDV